MGVSIPLGVPPGVLDGGQTYADYIASLTPTFWVKLQETSGSAANSGSDGNTGTVTSATQGQTGKLGANEAYLFDGADDLITFLNANVAGTKALTTQRWAFLANATSSGESTNGAFMGWGTLVGIKHAGSTYDAQIDTDGTTARSTTSAATIVTGAWFWLFVDYDDADALGGGRIIRVFTGASGTVSELGYGTQTAATGTVAAPAGDLIIGNRNTAAWTFDGPIDEALGGAGLWTQAIMERIVALTGV
jgi:hypothetical protein